MCPPPARRDESTMRGDRERELDEEFRTSAEILEERERYRREEEE